MQRVVPSVDGDRAALHGEGRLGVDRVVDGSVDGECQILDDEPRRALLIGRRTGLDAVFAVCGDGERARAADRDLRAVLALDDGVLRVGVIGVVITVVGGGIREGVLRSLGGEDRHAARLAAGDGGGCAAREIQTTEHERHARDALFHLDGAVGAGAGEYIGTRLLDGEGRAVDGETALVRGGDAALGEDDGRPLRGALGCEGRRDRRQQHRQRQKHRRELHRSFFQVQMVHPFCPRSRCAGRCFWFVRTG